MGLRKCKICKEMVKDWDGSNEIGGFVCGNCYTIIESIAYHAAEMAIEESQERDTE